MSLLSGNDKLGLQNALDEVADTFERDIYAFVSEASSAPSDTNYNPLFGRTKDQSSSINDIPLTKYTIPARVHYPDPEEKREVGEAISLEQSVNMVRLKVESSGYETLKRASRIEVDDELWTIVSKDKKVGPFSPEYYLVYLKAE